MNEVSSELAVEHQAAQPDVKDWQPKIIAFLCSWCSYGAADLVGVTRMQYPANVRVIRIPCTGRTSPKFILDALRHGADGIWVSG
jgi:coenzyme F420-reducing hydrogenase delta subunit